MNLELLREKALKLDELLKKYAPVDKEAALLQSTIDPWVQSVLAGRVKSPVPAAKIPGDRFIMESSLMEKHIDLVNAFGEFAIELSGGPPPGLLAFKARNQEK